MKKEKNNWNGNANAGIIKCSNVKYCSFEWERFRLYLNWMLMDLIRIVINALYGGHKKQNKHISHEQFILCVWTLIFNSSFFLNYKLCVI